MHVLLSNVFLFAVYGVILVFFVQNFIGSLLHYKVSNWQLKSARMIFLNFFEYS